MGALSCLRGWRGGNGPGAGVRVAASWLRDLRRGDGFMSLREFMDGVKAVEFDDPEIALLWEARRLRRKQPAGYSQARPFPWALGQN